MPFWKRYNLLARDSLSAFASLSSCGRIFYIYPEKNPCGYPGTVRDSQKWISSYKVRAIVEKSINVTVSPLHIQPVSPKPGVGNVVAQKQFFAVSSDACSVISLANSS
ncbi:MAG: hypothetical protein RSE54_08355 [Ruthenibacterium sp.]